MSESADVRVLASDLPRPGPFTVWPGLRLRALARALGLAALFFGVSWFFCGHSIDEIQRRLDVEEIWQNGRIAEHDVSYDGDVRDRSGFAKSYDVDVTFAVTEDGSPVTFDAKFLRLFGGPEAGDGMEVRYDPADPSRAVTSWEHEARLATWGRTVLFCLVAVVCGVAGVVLTHKRLGDYRGLVVAAKAGKLVVGRVESAKETRHADKSITYKAVVRTEQGWRYDVTFGDTDDSPCYVEGDEEIGHELVVMLVGEDGSFGRLIRHDGHPLWLRQQT